MFRLISFLIIALLVSTPAYAQDKSTEIDTIFSFATTETPGCAAGVSQNGKVVVNRSYGLANVERKLPLTQNSLFDIGSTQKQFTAAAVLILVEDKRLSLSDDIRKYLPELPDYGHKVTVDNLITHTGGIRDWIPLMMLAPEGSNVMQLLLRQRELNFAPGEEWSYSNGGFELAKEIVARVSGISFAEFARKRLFEPLGMKSSAYVRDIMHGGANSALGYQKDGPGWKPFMRLGNNRGGGAVVSTVGDLLIWNDALASAKLGKFVTEKLHEQTKLNNGRKLKYARGLFVDHTPGGLVVSHSGEAAGFSTWMGRVPKHRLSVVVTCNFDPVSATALAGRVADTYLPPVSRTVEDSVAKADAPSVNVTSMAGLFFNERTGEPMRLLAEDGTLRIATGPPLVAISPERFRPLRADIRFRSQDEFEMTFLSKEQIEFKSMEGQTTRYRRAQAFTPAAADLQSVQGRYESKEIGTVFEIVPETNNNIVMRPANSAGRSLNLTPVERDTYMLSMMIVRFRRDASGKVTGFNYGNPLMRNISFTRLADRTTAPETSTAPATKDPAAASASPTSEAPRLEGLTGEYELSPGRLLVITLEDGVLHGQPSGGEKRKLVHVSAATFSAADTPITLTFTLGADGRATAVVMRQNGRERTLTKIR